MVLVTGASGFVGGHVARALAGRGERVRILVRPTSDRRGIADLDVERVTGDLRDPDSLSRAVAGCELVYHVAADYRLWARDPGELYRANVDGTRNLLEAVRREGVRRVVYTSTVGCIGIRGDGTPGDEDSPVSLEEMTGAYKRSKFQAEQVALEYARTGLDVVVVNPTAPVGDRDVKPTPTGKIIVDFLLGRMPAYVDTGLNLVDVRDVAQGHLAAAERGRSGERYILGARNMTLREIVEELARLGGRPAPKVRIPYAVAWTYAAAGTALANLTGREPRAPLDAVRMSRKKMWVRIDKAERELGFAPGPVEEALRRAIEWFRENQYC
ncbi:MAG: NAD-dependent epimerase/dehydratase family protein [Acidobacteria bacterium]|nr:NAD-dependent epimerase/dehydratase family protein [Acidobacteriota bacterium]